MTQTNTAPRHLATGILLEVDEGRIILGLPGTDYRLYLEVDRRISTPLNKPITGRITTRARRVDRIPRGGRFIEPIYGRPRRLQGRITATDAQSNTITVTAGGNCSFVCQLVVNQIAGDFSPGWLVGFDVESGAAFEPMNNQ